MTARNRELFILAARSDRRLGRVCNGVVPGGGADRLRVGPLGPAPRRGLRRRAPRRADDRPGRRSDAPPDHRAPLRDRPHVRLPARPRGRAQAARLGRGRRRCLRGRPALAALGLPRARAVQVHLRRLGDRAADAPVRARARGADQRREAVGDHRPAPVPTGRAREDLPRHLPRRVPARQARGARAAQPEGRRAAGRDLGRGDARPRPDERPRLGAPQLRDLPRDALRGDGTGVVRRRPASCCSPAAPALLYDKLDRVQQRVTVWLEPWTDDKVYCALNGGDGVPPELRLLPAGQEPLLDRERRLRRHRHRKRDVRVR